MASNVEGGGARKKRAVRFMCCTPVKQCDGQVTSDNAKSHSSSDEVLKCQGKYLETQGYVRLGKREYKSPNDGPILILNKKASRAKGGKSDRYMRGNRKDQRLRSW